MAGEPRSRGFSFLSVTIYWTRVELDRFSGYSEQPMSEQIESVDWLLLWECHIKYFIRQIVYRPKSHSCIYPIWVCSFSCVCAHPRAASILYNSSLFGKKKNMPKTEKIRQFFSRFRADSKQSRQQQLRLKNAHTKRSCKIDSPGRPSLEESYRSNGWYSSCHVLVNEGKEKWLVNPADIIRCYCNNSTSKIQQQRTVQFTMKG
jgi:hypothetical protein